jgi:hypothetical protein
MFSRIGHLDRRLSFATGIGYTSGSLMEGLSGIGRTQAEIRRFFFAPF